MARVQTGVRIDKQLLKVLKALAEYHGVTLGGLIEEIVLHAFQGRPAFDQETLDKIAEIAGVYGLDLLAEGESVVAVQGAPAQAGSLEGAIEELSRLLDPER